MESARLLVIILHFGCVKDTVECLDSLQVVTQPLDIFVVNNGPDESVEKVLKAKHSNIIYRHAGIETGFAAGNNIGLRFSLDHSYRYSLLLNNDVVAEHDFVRPLIHTLSSDSTTAMAGPAIYVYDNKEQLWSCGGKIRWWSGGLGGVTTVSHPNLEEVDVDYLPGACILVRNKALETIGLLSEEYFLGVEEAEWAVRARRAGFRVVACPKSVLLHKVGVSSGYSSELVYNAVRNRFLFLRRNLPIVISHLLIFCVLINEIRKHRRHRWACWRAFADHLKYRKIERSHLDRVRRYAERAL